MLQKKKKKKKKRPITLTTCARCQKAGKVNTHSSAKVGATVGAVSNDAQSSLVALLLAVELATLLGRHVLASRGGWLAGCGVG
jgi:hypothetical protein